MSNLCALCFLAYLAPSPYQQQAQQCGGLIADFWLLPDRVNISNAKIFSLVEDLELGTDSVKFNTALVIFFIPYCLFEIPSNILLKKFRPHVWLSLNMFLFGLTTMMQGLVQNYAGLLTTRFFLGLFETGMFPGGESFPLVSLFLCIS